MVLTVMPLRRICWPGGQSLPEGDGNCRRRLATWLLDGSQPPTLLLPETGACAGYDRCGGYDL